MRRIITAVLTVLSALTAFAESPETTLFRSHVKSVEEFIARFNGDELDPSLPEGSNASMAIYRLIDPDFAHSMPADSMLRLADALINAVRVQNIKLDLLNPLNEIEAECSFVFKGKPCPLTLIFVREEFRPGFQRLALSEVRGMDAAGIITEQPLYPINPLEHEMHFMELHDLMNNKKDYVSTLIAGNKTLDSTSYFIGLIQHGVLKYVQCNDVSVRFRQVPGFDFSIRETVHPGDFSSGWLITELRN